MRVKVYFQEQGPGDRWAAVEKLLDLYASGWHTFPLTNPSRPCSHVGERAQAWTEKSRAAGATRGAVAWDPGEESHRPSQVQARWATAGTASQAGPGVRPGGDQPVLPAAVHRLPPHRLERLDHCAHRYYVELMRGQLPWPTWPGCRLGLPPSTRPW